MTTIRSGVVLEALMTCSRGSRTKSRIDVPGPAPQAARRRLRSRAKIYAFSLMLFTSRFGQLGQVLERCGGRVWRIAARPGQRKECTGEMAAAEAEGREDSSCGLADSQRFVDPSPGGVFAGTRRHVAKQLRAERMNLGR